MLITMVLCGLWHGANWTFILWGALHGVALVVAALWRRHGPRMPAPLGWALTVMFVLLTGVIFRATSLEAAMNIFQGLGYALNLDRGKHLLSLAIVPLIAFLLPASQDIIAWLTQRPRPSLFVLAGLILFVILLDLGERNVAGFGYFNF
jgi:alginate O-acetyltransferase complex protein AlgI